MREVRCDEQLLGLALTPTLAGVVQAGSTVVLTVRREGRPTNLTVHKGDHADNSSITSGESRYSSAETYRSSDSFKRSPATSTYRTPPRYEASAGVRAAGGRHY